ncbi:MAG: MoaD/ThiS family protein [Dehalococcoidia bacterium]|nr:MoaD/ThiS family protein [Dehalococcoidia bacterium]
MMIRVEIYPRTEALSEKRYLEAEPDTTLRQFMGRLVEAHGSHLGMDFIDQTTGEIKLHYMVVINGKRVSPSERDEMILKDGDVVSIIRPHTGG